MKHVLYALPLLIGCSANNMETSAKTSTEPTTELATNLYDFTLTDIDGKPVKLEKYKGKVLLIVNVASKCGLTPQYNGLQKLYSENKDKGLVVLGFPANNFGGQEPGTEEEIKTFCTTNYNVTFPMFSKVSVKGNDTHPLFKWLIASSDRPTEEIEWNFAKFLVGRDGKLVKRFSPRETPDSETVKTAVNKALASS